MYLLKCVVFSMSSRDSNSSDDKHKGHDCSNNTINKYYESLDHDDWHINLADRLGMEMARR